MAAGHGRGEETLRPPQGEAEPNIPRGTGHVRSHTPDLVLFKLRCNIYITSSFPPSLPPSLPPLRPSLFPSLPSSLSPSLPPFLPPSLPPSLRWMWCSICYSHRLRRFQREETCSAAQASDRSEPLELVVWHSLTICTTQLRQTIVLGGHSLSPLPLTCHFDPLCCVQALGDEMKTIHAVSIKIGNAE